jgi:hypothetical protein
MLEELYSKIKPFLIKEPYDGKDPPCIVQLLVSRISLKDRKDLLTFAQILAEYYIYFRLLKPDKVFNYLHMYIPELSEEDLINVIKKVLSSRPSKFYCSEFLLDKEDVKAYCRGEIEAKEVRTYKTPNPLLEKFCRKIECELLTWLRRNFFFGEVEKKKMKIVKEVYGKVKYKAVYELDGNTIICKARGVKSYWTYPSQKEAEEVFNSLKEKIKLKFYISPEEVKEWLRQKP